MNSFAGGSNVVRLKGVEERLGESERRYRELFEFAPVSLWEEDWSGAKKLIDGLRAQGVHDLHRYLTEHPDFVGQIHAGVRYLDVNAITLEIYGASDKRELLEEMHVRNLGPSLEGATERYVALAQGQPYVTGEYISRRLDGAEFDVLVTISIPRAHRADWSRVLVAVEDISERKATQNSLIEKTALLDSFISHAPYNMGVKDTQGRYVFVNPNWSSSFGISNEDAQGKTAFDIFPKDVADEYRAQDLEVLKTLASSTIENTARHSDGTDHFYLAKKFPILNGAGEAFALGWMDIDITDRKKAEDALYDSEEQLRAIFENAPFEITIKDIAGRYAAVNRHWEKTYKMTNAEAKGKLPIDIFPPESGETMMAHDREVIETGKTVTREVTVPWVNGARTYVSTKFPIRSANKEIVSIVSLPIDITDRKRDELALAESEKRYRHLTELAPYLVCIHDDGEIKYINPAGARLLGAESPSVLVGRTMEELIHPDSLGLVKRYERQAREKRIPQPKIEARAVRVDGEVIDIEISFIPFDDLEIKSVQIFARDITEQKRAKEILDRSPGYREDLTDRFMKSGGHVLFDHELLELILFSVHRRRNVRVVVERLLDRFGSFAEVISADPQRLAEVQGVGEATIITLKAAQEAALRLIRNEIIGRSAVGSWKQVLDYLSAAMAYNTTEQFRVLFLDRKNIVISDEVLQDGTLDHAPIYPRQIIKRALEIDASALILVHNHPSGDSKPSHDDIELTKRVIAAGKPLGIEVHDHVIIGKGSPASLKSMGLI